MKCVDGCGYSESPNNIQVLTRHVEACSVAHPASEKKVVWRNSELVVVAEHFEDETVLFDSFRDFEDAPEVPPLLIPSQAGVPAGAEPENDFVGEPVDDPTNGEVADLA